MTNLNYCVLRYFNVGGEDNETRKPLPTRAGIHLIKVLSEVASGKRPAFHLYGTNFPTRDGTTIRDYVHVIDVARANLAAVEYLESGGASTILNVGTGVGTSIREVLTFAANCFGKEIPVIEEPALVGDVPCLIADIRKIQSLLHWEPHFDLRQMLFHAYESEFRRILAPALVQNASI